MAIPTDAEMKDFEHSGRQFKCALACVVVLLTSLFLENVSADDCQSNDASGRPPKTKNEWLKTLSFIRPGMNVFECEDRVEKTLGRWKGRVLSPFTTRSDRNPDDLTWMVFRLDATWYLVMEYDARENVTRVFVFDWIERLEKDDKVDESLLPLVRAIHSVPFPGSVPAFSQLDGTPVFDSVALVRTVNTLRSAGLKRSVKALRTYEELCRYGEYSFLFYGKLRVFLIAPLLFERRDGNEHFPIPKPDGNPTFPEYRFLRGLKASTNDVLDQHYVDGDPHWPDFPLVLSGELPLLAAWGYLVPEMTTEPGPLLDFIEKECCVRAKPLKPSDTPWEALEKFVRSSAASREPDFQDSGIAMFLRLQVLRALRPAADAERRKEIDSFLTPTYDGGRELNAQGWCDLCKWFASHGTYWDGSMQSYQVRRR